jgi:hypothetical protein
MLSLGGVKINADCLAIIRLAVAPEYDPGYHEADLLLHDQHNSLRFELWTEHLFHRSAAELMANSFGKEHKKEQPQFNPNFLTGFCQPKTASLESG